jgi:hypothetical protein
MSTTIGFRSLGLKERLVTLDVNQWIAWYFLSTGHPQWCDVRVNAKTARLIFSYALGGIKMTDGCALVLGSSHHIASVFAKTLANPAASDRWAPVPLEEATAWFEKELLRLHSRQAIFFDTTRRPWKELHKLSAQGGCKDGMPDAEDQGVYETANALHAPIMGHDAAFKMAAMRQHVAYYGPTEIFELMKLDRVAA